MLISHIRYQECDRLHAILNELTRMGISCREKRARRMEKADYAAFDLIIGMEQRNVTNMLRITGGDPDNKIYKLLSFADSGRDIADPWYTGNFDETYEDILEGCTAFLKKVQK